MMTEDEIRELKALKARLDALRAEYHSDRLYQLQDLMDQMWRWILTLDDEIDELTSQLCYYERKLEGEEC